VTAGEAALKEHPMNDTEEAVHRLLAVAAEDVPPGIDLLRGVRARSRGRAVRIRSLVAVGAAGIVAAAAAITLSAVQAPSAFAQVSRAAALTAAQSYQVSATETIVQIGGLRSQPWTTASGEFDPVLGVGEAADNLGSQVRYVGGYAYVFVTDSLRAASEGTNSVPIPAWASWERLPLPLRPGPGVTRVELAMLGAFPALPGQAGPQDLLALLQSATQVREVGPASGPGWTGSAYSFTVSTTLSGPPHTAVSFSGTVDVDQLGRVRRLGVLESSVYRAAAGQTERNIEISYADFGLPVSVSAPPASETFIPPAS
jgi:hypothetical protein